MTFPALQLLADGRQRHVHDRRVQADDEQAQAADGQHQVPAPLAQPGHYDHLRNNVTASNYLLYDN
jgi:hypothetical protein